jgi:hypothetical protein
VGEKSRHEDALVQAVAAHYHRVATHINTLASIPEYGFNFVRTLQRSPAWACQHGSPLLGQRVFVAGAGASLDDFADVLPEIAARGHVLCSNTGVGALLRSGVTPDAVTYCERLHTEHHLAGYGGAVVLESRASQRAWDTAPHPLCCSQNDPDLARYLVRMRVAPLKYEISAFNAAVAQAFAWGAAEIVILGASYAVFHGSAYARGSAHEGATETIEDGRVTSRGKASIPEAESAVLELPAIGGGTIASPAYFADEIASLAAMASRVPIRNLNRRGVVIPNVPAVELADVLAMPPLAERHDFCAPLPAVDASAVLGSIEQECRRYLEAPTPNPPPGIVRFFGRRALMMQGAHRDWSARRRALIDAMALGALGVIDILG